MTVTENGWPQPAHPPASPSWPAGGRDHRDGGEKDEACGHEHPVHVGPAAGGGGARGLCHAVGVAGRTGPGAGEAAVPSPGRSRPGRRLGFLAGGALLAPSASLLVAPAAAAAPSRVLAVAAASCAGAPHLCGALLANETALLQDLSARLLLA